MKILERLLLSIGWGVAATSILYAFGLVCIVLWGISPYVFAVVVSIFVSSVIVSYRLMQEKQ